MATAKKKQLVTFAKDALIAVSAVHEMPSIATNVMAIEKKKQLVTIVIDATIAVSAVRIPLAPVNCVRVAESATNAEHAVAVMILRVEHPAVPA